VYNVKGKTRRSQAGLVIKYVSILVHLKFPIAFLRLGARDEGFLHSWLVIRRVSGILIIIIFFEVTVNLLLVFFVPDLHFLLIRHYAQI